jgi:hypothetical protein
MSLAPRIYPEAPAAEAFSQLLVRNLLPCASRRHPQIVDEIMTDYDVQEILSVYEIGLKGIFMHYADRSDHNNRRLNTQPAKSRSQTIANRTLPSPRRKPCPVAASMQFTEFRKFCSDFNLISTETMSQLQAGHTFLCCVDYKNPRDSGSKSSGIRRENRDKAPAVRFLKFSELLVRISQNSFQNKAWLTPADRLKVA